MLTIQWIRGRGMLSFQGGHGPPNFLKISIVVGRNRSHTSFKSQPPNEKSLALFQYVSHRNSPPQIPTFQFFFLKWKNISLKPERNTQQRDKHSRAVGQIQHSRGKNTAGHQAKYNKSLWTNLDTAGGGGTPYHKHEDSPLRAS